MWGPGGRRGARKIGNHHKMETRSLRDTRNGPPGHGDTRGPSITETGGASSSSTAKILVDGVLSRSCT